MLIHTCSEMVNKQHRWLDRQSKAESVSRFDINILKRQLALTVQLKLLKLKEESTYGKKQTNIPTLTYNMQACGIGILTGVAVKHSTL